MSAAARSTTRPLRPLQTSGLVDDVYHAVLDLLVAGALPADSPLAIDEIARSLSVSPTPVREALARLEHTGLILRHPRRGYRVAPPMSAEQMTELLDARLVLETGAIRRAVERDGEALRTELAAALTAHEAAAAGLGADGATDDLDAVHAYFSRDWAFHQTILDHCGNRYINRAVNSLSFSVHRMRQTVGAGASDASVAIREHATVLAAVRAGDAEGAEAAMREHLENVARRSVG